MLRDIERIIIIGCAGAALSWAIHLTLTQGAILTLVIAVLYAKIDHWYWFHNLKEWCHDCGAHWEKQHSLHCPYCGSDKVKFWKPSPDIGGCTCGCGGRFRGIASPVAH